MTKHMNYRIKLLIFLLPVFLVVGNATGQNAVSGTKVFNGKKCFPHLIKAKETWTGIAREHKIAVKDLQDANSGISDLKIGQVIYVPITEVKSISEIKTTPPKDQINTKNEKPVSVKAPVVAEQTVAKKASYIYHTVKKGETLYSISKLYKKPIADVMKWNNLKSNEISLGSNLIVGTEDAKPEKSASIIAPITQNENVKPVNAVEEYNKQLKETAIKPTSENKSVEKTESKEKTEIKAIDSSKTKDTPVKDIQPGGVEQVNETGVATWFNDQELNQNKFYALHRTAPIGTIIKVTNRMNNNSVFVKVVGVLPATGDNDNIIIKITSASAQRIGAIDQKFTAELSYSVTH